MRRGKSGQDRKEIPDQVRDEEEQVRDGAGHNKKGIIDIFGW